MLCRFSLHQHATEGLNLNRLRNRLHFDVKSEVLPAGGCRSSLSTCRIHRHQPPMPELLHDTAVQPL